MSHAREYSNIVRKKIGNVSMNKALFMKILKIAGNVLTYAFMAVCLALVIFSFSFKKTSDDALTIFGMQARIIQSDSMEKSEFTNVANTTSKASL